MSRRTSRLSWAHLALGALACLLIASQCTAIATEAINWDEFGLFHRAAATLRTGSLAGGGRPGLGTLLVMPLVNGCHDAIAVAQRARLLTLLATLALAAGLFVSIRLLLRGVRERADLDAAFGVGLMVLVPAFLRWSLQTRTDQWTLACGIWGAAALVGSQSMPALAGIAGALFALGWLFSQKVAYVLMLAVLLVAGRHLLVNDFAWRRELKRACWCALAAGVLVAVYYAWTGSAFRPPTSTSAPDAGNSDFYRQVVGYRVYAGMLPSLAPHLVLLSLLFIVSLRSRSDQLRRQVLLAWGSVALGLGVGLVHASAFPYFWMTLGLFAGVAGAVALEPVRGLFTSVRTRGLVEAALWAALVLPALPFMLTMHADTQRVQREAFAFVDKNFERTARGFHPEGGLFCRPDPEPYPFYIAPSIANAFARKGEVERFVTSFVQRPVSFMIESYRLGQFPEPVQRFWSQHYVLYGPATFIPGFSLDAKAVGVAQRDIDVIVPGRYRWLARPLEARAEVDGKLLRNGQTIALSAGSHALRVADPIESGLLAYAVNAQPAPEVDFYSPSSVHEVTFGY